VRGSAALVRRAARHADVVLVYMHAGAEGTGAEHVRNAEETFLGEPRGNPVGFAHTMIKAGADLVFASGPHVLRGIEWYRGRLIAYSLGNLAATNTLSTQGSLALSSLLRVTLDGRGRFATGSIVSLRLVGDGTPVFDSQRAAIGAMRALSKEDFGPRAMRISKNGRLSPPKP
jgi:poly-gamma-glutamate capsule biosynthesis protein CapA/YwtB (metallophosphatase superfamily)